MEISASLISWGEKWSSRFLPTVDAFLTFFSENPLVRGVQIFLLTVAVGLIFLVFSATRDILHRSRSLFVQVSCILLVAALPLVGFLLYLLLRPRRTLEERDMHEKIGQILDELQKKNSGVGGRAFSPRAHVPALLHAKPKTALRTASQLTPVSQVSREFSKRPVPALVSP